MLSLVVTQVQGCSEAGTRGEGLGVPTFLYEGDALSMFPILLRVPTSILRLHPCSMGTLCQGIEAPTITSWNSYF